MFEPGQRVRCVNSRGWVDPRDRSIDGPKFGDVCTVADVKLLPHPRTRTSALFARLAEHPAERVFLADLFQPLEDRELDRLREFIVAPPVKARQLAGVLP